MGRGREKALAVHGKRAISTKSHDFSVLVLISHDLGDTLNKMCLEHRRTTPYDAKIQ